MKSQGIGHLLALTCIFIWGVTYISTKVLLQHIGPADILIARFFLGYLALWLLYPKFGKRYGKVAELYCLLAGFLGIFVYFYMENVALVYTTASNVGVLICLAPFFTTMLSKILNPKQTTLYPAFFAGLVISFVGVGMICLAGQEIEFNPMGDGLAISAALVWAAYSITLKKVAQFDMPILLSTRKIFGYSLLFIGGAFLLADKKLSIDTLLIPEVSLNLVFLGLFASAACYAMWTKAVTIIGPGPSSVYIYLTPVICLITANIVLHEQLTRWGLIGTCLVFIGLIFSQMSQRISRWIHFSRL